MTDDERQAALVGDMGQRFSLLTGEDQPALSRLYHCRRPMHVPHAIPLHAGQEVSRVVQTLFRRDHALRAEALLAARILPKRHQVGGSTQRIEHLSVLLHPHRCEDLRSAPGRDW
jgi:hypothetical protein